MVEAEPPREFRRTHVFYYPWYSTPSADGRWLHWNHRVLPHWDKDVAERFLRNVHYDPEKDDLGCSFFPALGPYSSRDPAVLDAHMHDLRDYVVVVSWWGRNGGADGEGHNTDSLVPRILAAAARHGAKVAFHIEPYPGRTAESVAADLKYIHAKYGASQAFYRSQAHGNRTVVYVYDSYHISAENWARVLLAPSRDSKRPHSIRGTPHDAVVLGLLLNGADWTGLKNGGFDGAYTYFAADGFTGGSTRRQWRELCAQARSKSLLFSLSVGPGYIDTRIRPWNSMNTHSRQGGKYYTEGLRLALEASPDFLSITSYNEWHEGSQIEPAVPKKIPQSIMPDNGSRSLGEFHYLDYTQDDAGDPEVYLHLTNAAAARFEDS